MRGCLVSPSSSRWSCGAPIHARAREAAVERQQPSGEQVPPDAPQAAELVVRRQHVAEGVEGDHDQGIAARHLEVGHVAAVEVRR